MSQAWFAARNRPRQLPRAFVERAVHAIIRRGGAARWRMGQVQCSAATSDGYLSGRYTAPHVILACGSKPNHRTKKIMIDVPGNFCHRLSRASCDAVTVPKMFSRRLEATALKQPPKYQQNDMAGPIVNMPIKPGRSSAIVRLRLR
jgi:hypothetical protein